MAMTVQFAHDMIVESFQNTEVKVLFESADLKIVRAFANSVFAVRGSGECVQNTGELDEDFGEYVFRFEFKDGTIIKKAMGKNGMLTETQSFLYLEDLLKNRRFK